MKKLFDLVRYVLLKNDLFQGAVAPCVLLVACNAYVFLLAPRDILVVLLLVALMVGSTVVLAHLFWILRKFVKSNGADAVIWVKYGGYDVNRFPSTSDEASALSPFAEAELEEKGRNFLSFCTRQESLKAELELSRKELREFPELHRLKQLRELDNYRRRKSGIEYSIMVYEESLRRVARKLEKTKTDFFKIFDLFKRRGMTEVESPEAILAPLRLGSSVVCKTDEGAAVLEARPDPNPQET